MSVEKLQCPFCKGVFEESEFCNEAGQMMSICMKCQAAGAEVSDAQSLTCCVCNLSKGYHLYHKDSRRRSGRFPICKECRKKSYLAKKTVKE